MEHGKLNEIRIVPFFDGLNELTKSKEKFPFVSSNYLFRVIVASISVYLCLLLLFVQWLALKWPCPGADHDKILGFEREWLEGIWSLSSWVVRDRREM